MLRSLLLTALLALPISAQADACGGQNLFETMPASELATLKARAGKIPYGQGLLWHATKGSREITLFGSYHLPHDFTEAHLQTLLPMARKAEVNYFEMNSADTKKFEREMASKPDFMFIAKGKTLPELLSPEDWAALTGKMRERGFPPFMVAKMKPIFVTMMLGMTPCKLKLMQSGAQGIDRSLALALEAQDVPTRSIEHYTTAAKLFDVYPLDEQVEMLRLSLIESINSDDMAETLYQSYISEEIGLFWEYTRHMSLLYGGDNAEEDFAIFEELLLTERNLAWLTELEKAPEQALFVTVGAAHLPGDIGVLNLLAQRGYSIKRLPLN